MSVQELPLLLLHTCDSCCSTVSHDASFLPPPHTHTHTHTHSAWTLSSSVESEGESAGSSSSSSSRSVFFHFWGVKVFWEKASGVT
ncbi:hypothetical protein JOB18_044155 [Solea senegalensis]|uniref:Secreted protein n=1 Tax=Solea senegalensis TaxID=28829 RepID=A0AAV6Q2E9_SOLSE|nr:hypothetical protein JOB18_044155 [Solea senegalensis]